MDENKFFVKGQFKRKRFLIDLTILAIAVCLLSQTLYYNNSISADRNTSGRAVNGNSKATKTTTTSISASITSPSNDETVHGTVPVSVSTSTGIKSVTLYVDGYFADANMVAPFATSLSTANLQIGVHPIFVIARDFNGSEVKSNVVNLNVVAPLPTDDILPPTAKILSPTPWSVVNKGIVPIEIDSKDNVGVAYVSLFIDGNQPIKLLPGVKYDWDTSNLTSGSWHNLQAQAFDASSNYYTAPLVTVQIGN